MGCVDGRGGDAGGLVLDVVVVVVVFVVVVLLPALAFMRGRSWTVK